MACKLRCQANGTSKSPSYHLNLGKHGRTKNCVNVLSKKIITGEMLALQKLHVVQENTTVEQNVYPVF